MSDDILRALGELKAGQASLHTKADALQGGQDGLVTAVSESNEAVLSAVQALSSKVGRLENKLDQLDKNLTSHMAGTSDSVERLTATVEAINNRLSGGDAPPRIASAR